MNNNHNDDPATTTTTTVVVSAPGKILLAGGYLVLEEANVGVVVAVDKRFYCECRLTRTTTSSGDSSSRTAATTTTNVTVESPQFGGATWKYQWRDHQLFQIVDPQQQQQQDNKNPFVEKALRVALLYLQQQQQPITTTTTITEIHLKLAADNDFYSLVPHLQARQWPCEYAAAQRLPLRLPAAVRPSTKTTPSYYKTGLGSSACLVTALTASLVRAWQQQSQQQEPTTTPTILTTNTTEEDPLSSSSSASASTSAWIDTVARLAQIGHCYAQNKVGSGFDVSAACYGSHVYRRFPAAFLHDILDVLGRQEPEPPSGGDDDDDPTRSKNKATAASTLLRTLVDQPSPWTGGVQSALHSFVASSSGNSSSTPKPSFLQCLMADVAGGSESPGMARQVLQWRQQQQQLQQSGPRSSGDSYCPHWDDLATINARIVALLQELDQLTSSWTVEEQVQRQEELIQCHPRDWSLWPSNNSAVVAVVARLLSELRHTFQECRRHLKAMGDVAGGVPIEPAPQTALCNACQEIPGVVTALVPGAGGYDAVVCVYIATASVARAVTDLWATWKSTTTNNNNNNSQQLNDEDGNGGVVTVCPLTVQGADFGQGLRIEPEFPSLAGKEEEETCRK